MIGEELHLSDDDLSKLQWAGLLHDVGKLFVPTEILTKPGSLTSEEFEVVKGHPAWGAELCEPLRGWLGEWVDAVGQHHERWVGGGYPAGIAGEDIALAARVVAVADAFDVMTSARSYKPPVSAASARDELTRCAGTQFDPRVVRAFLNLSLGRLRLVMGPVSSLAQLPALGRAPLGPVLGGAVSGLATAATLFVGGLVSLPGGEDRTQVIVTDDDGGAGSRSSSPSVGGPDRSDEANPSPPDDGTPTDPPGDVAAGPSDTTGGGDAPPPAGASPPTTTGGTDPVGGGGGGDSGSGGGPTTTTTGPPAPAPTAWYLRSSGTGPDDWALAASRPPVADPEPDRDGDGAPGLTVKKSDQKLTNSDGAKYQHWNLVAGTPIHLDGVLTLGLWSSVKDFKPDKEADSSVWVLDCAANGTGCTTLASAVDVHVDGWNGGMAGWSYRPITVGSVSHTVAPGRMLRLRVMFNHEDVWISTSGARPSALVRRVSDDALTRAFYPIDLKASIISSLRLVGTS